MTRGSTVRLTGFAVDVQGDGDGAGSDDIGGGGRGLGFSFEQACSHGARTDAHAAEESAAGDRVLASGLGSFFELTRHLPFRT